MTVSGDIVITEISFIGDEEKIEQAAEIYAKSVVRQVKEKTQEDHEAKEVKEAKG